VIIPNPSAQRIQTKGHNTSHRGWIAHIHGDEEKWEKEWQTFLSHWLGESGQ
jgi:hypothetical protein